MAWLADWAKRVKLTIDQGDIDDALANFPVLVHLSVSSGRLSDDVSFVFDELESDANRKKIAITTSDGQTQCYVEIERWEDVNKKAWLWVKVPSVVSGANTDLYLYYDKTKADNTDYVGDKQSTPGEAVWDAGYQGVLHFDEPSGILYDSTSNDKDIIAGGSPIYAAAGKIGKGIKYVTEGVSNKLYTSSPFDTIGHDWTLEFWAEYFRITDYQTIIWHQADATGSWRELITVDSSGNIKVWWRNGPSGGDTLANMVWDAWHYWVFRYDDATQKLYVYKDRVLQNPGGYSADLGNAGNLAKWAHFTRWDAATQGGRGTLDEWRFSTMLRSVAWIKASYESERDHLLDFGSEELGKIVGPFPTHFNV